MKQGYREEASAQSYALSAKGEGGSLRRVMPSIYQGRSTRDIYTLYIHQEEYPVLYTTSLLYPGRYTPVLHLSDINIACTRV